MGLIDDIGRMQGEGRSDVDIKAALRQRGASDSEIEGAMSQVMIKGAVNRDPGYPPQDYQAPQPGENYYSMQPQESQFSSPGYEGMQPSVMSPQEEYISSPAAAETAYQSPDPSYGAYSSYPQYQSYQESMSSDVITEIAEQVVTDKLSLMQDKVEEVADFRSVAEAKLKNVEERLERIESILDKLQLAILQRVSEYVDDVKGMRKELQETQKSFKAMASSKSSEEKPRPRSDLPDLAKRAF
jgi:hypothetical protein